METTVVLTFESVDEILLCDHSNETSSAVFSHGTTVFVLYVVLTFESVDEIVLCGHSNGTSPAVLSLSTIWFSVFFFHFRY